jgi:TRAP-type C4-dicarboxylate transport system permease small subunit
VFKTFFRILNHIEEYILCLMVLQMGLSVFLQVVLRYTFHAAITWLDELVHIEVVLLTFFGAGLGIKYGSHISVDILKKSFKEPFESLLDVLNHLIIAAYVALVVYFGAGLIKLMAERPHFTPTLRIPKHYLYFIVCVGLSLICIRSIFKCCQILSDLFSGKSTGRTS